MQATQTAFETVTAYLSWDHDRLDAILLGVCQHLDVGRFEQARRAYGDFDDGLRRHIRIEEELLFPLFEVRSGVRGGPTTVMREEHREIQRAMVIMRDGLAQSDTGAFREGLRFLRETLPEHNAKEEHVLYPTTDRLLSDPERAAFVSRLQAS